MFSSSIRQYLTSSIGTFLFLFLGASANFKAEIDVVTGTSQ